MKNEQIPKAVIARLPRYYRCVEDLYRTNCIRVSSATLSNLMGITASQVRQDFSCFGGFGLQGYGYNVHYLRYELRRILGLENKNTAILVGCGTLGQILLKSFDFENFGIFLIAAFDTNPDVIGTQVGFVNIMDLNRLESFAKIEVPDMAILAVSRTGAPETARLIADVGIPSIWSFAGCPLGVEDRILVEQVSFTDSLLQLSYRLKMQRETDSETPSQ